MTGHHDAAVAGAAADLAAAHLHLSHLTNRHEVGTRPAPPCLTRCALLGSVRQAIQIRCWPVVCTRLTALLQWAAGHARAGARGRYEGFAQQLSKHAPQEEMQALMCELEHSRRRLAEAANAASEARGRADGNECTVLGLEDELQQAR